MSQRAVKWTLWTLAFFVAPLPYMLGGLEIAPPLRLAFLTTIIAALQISEGPGGWVWNTFLALGAGQLFAYTLGLYMVAALSARAFGRIEPRSRLIAVSALCSAAILGAALYPIYETPMSSEAAQSSLLQVLL